MEPGELLSLIAARLFGGTVLVALPALAYVLANMIWRVPALAFFHRVAILSRLSITGGFLLGFGVVATAANRPSLNVNAVLANGGAWDIPWRTFLVQVGDPGHYSYAPLWQHLTVGDLDLPWLIYGVMTTFTLLAAALATLVMLRGEEFIIGIVAMAYQILVIQALTIYVILLLAYTLCTFNFWTALLALGVLQYYRHMKH